jgi:hypothetical protein
MSGPKIVTLDIETAPVQSYHWSLWDQNIAIKQIKVDWTILSFSYKWLGDPKVYYSDTSGGGPYAVRNDTGLLLQLWTLLDEADIVIGQNAQKFDVKKINARLFAEGYGPYRPIKVIDTLLIAKSKFAFLSNKLEYMSKMTTNPKSEHKKFPGFDLWLACLADNPEAWAEMKKYNEQDVISTEELYLMMRPWMEGHPNVANHDELDQEVRETERCPKCASTALIKEGYKYTQTGRYQQYRCGSCGGWSRSRYTLNTIAERKALLTN